MQDNENEWSSSPQGGDMEDVEEEPQVPSTLRPDVLQRLGLTPELMADDFELSVDDLIAKLQSDRWEERVVAVRALGKLETAVPVGMFSSARHDEDATVRAATVHVLGNMGSRTPLTWLVEALQDSDWHVREVAALALGKQGERVPGEVLMTALHDKDGSVREAARFALQWNNEKKSYGKLWEEERPMQQEHYDTALSNGKRKSAPLDAPSSDDWNGAFFEYSGARVLKEQSQTYAAREFATPDHVKPEPSSYEYVEVMPSRGEKITSYRVRTRSQKGWWAVVIITAGLFLMLGRLTASGVPISIGVSKIITAPAIPERMFPFDYVPYAPIFQTDLARGLNLTPSQLQVQLKQRGSFEAVAANQGVSSAQLQKIELSAFQDVVNNAVKTGDIDQAAAGDLMQRLQNDPGFREKGALILFNAAPIPTPAPSFPTPALS